MTLPFSLFRRLPYLIPPCLLQAVFGLLYATGVFTPHLPPSYTLCVGIAGLFTSVGITLCGILMSSLPSRTAARRIAQAGSLLLFAQALLPFALRHDIKTVLFISSAAMGIGGGALYVASVDVLLLWVPEHPGRVTGIGMLFGGSGTLLGVKLYSYLLDVMKGAYEAVLVAGLVGGAIAFVSASLLCRPTENWEDAREEEQCLLEERKLNVSQVLTDRAFYVVLLAFAATVGPGFGIVLAFQQMMHALFDVSIDRANSFYMWITVAGVGARLLSGVGVDVFGGALEGAKRMTGVLLMMQTMALLGLPFFVEMQWGRGFAVLSAVIFVAFSGGPVVAACMTRGVFGATNSSLAFSLVGVSIGMGDLFFAWVVAKCSQGVSYGVFVSAGLLWSVVGLGATAIVRKSYKVERLRKEEV